MISQTALFKYIAACLISITFVYQPLIAYEDIASKKYTLGTNHSIEDIGKAGLIIGAAGFATYALTKLGSWLFTKSDTTIADHMDEDSLKMLRAQQPLVMVPQGNGAWFTQNGFNYVTEFTWWQEQEIVIKHDNISIKITSVPARHWSGRTFTDTNATLWCGWVVSTDKDAVYFAGDTGYSKRQFDEIHAVFPSITYALLPIGPNKPDYLNSIHMDAEQAVQAYIDLEAQLCIPMHWGTFGFGIDEFMEPVDRMKKAWDENKLSEEKLLVLKCGQRHAVSD